MGLTDITYYHLYILAIILIAGLLAILQYLDIRTTFLAIHKYACAEELNPHIAQYQDDPFTLYTEAWDMKSMLLLAVALEALLAIAMSYIPFTRWVSILLFIHLASLFVYYFWVVVGNIDTLANCVILA